jgi:hypothetical protein
VKQTEIPHSFFSFSGKFKKPRRFSFIEMTIGLILFASIIFGIATMYSKRKHGLGAGSLHATAADLSDQMVRLIQEEKDKAVSFETGLGHTCNVDQAIPDVENEVACWQDDVAHALSNGSARIVLDSSTVPSQYVITISWTDPRAGTASYVQRVAVGANSPK